MSAVLNQDDSPMVVRENRDGVAYLTLNRPGQFNALSEAMLNALIAEIATRTALAAQRAETRLRPTRDFSLAAGAA